MALKQTLRERHTQYQVKMTFVHRLVHIEYYTEIGLTYMLIRSSEAVIIQFLK